MIQQEQFISLLEQLKQTIRDEARVMLERFMYSSEDNNNKIYKFNGGKSYHLSTYYRVIPRILYIDEHDKLMFKYDMIDDIDHYNLHEDIDIYQMDVDELLIFLQFISREWKLFKRQK